MNALRTNRRGTHVPRAVAWVSAILVCASFATRAADALPATSPTPAVTSKLVGDTPQPVAAHAVAPLNRHDANAVLSLNVGLAVHNSDGLDSLIRAASTPGNPAYGHYLSAAQYRTEFAPTDAEVAAVRSWLSADGVHVTGVSPDNLIVSAEANTSTVDRAFAVSVNDYRDGRRTFYANDVAPSVPSALRVQWVSGLNDFLVPQSFRSAPATSPAAVPAMRTGGYFPSDFQHGYDIANTTVSQSIGFTLWGAPLIQPDLNNFATVTTTPRIVIGQVGADGIDFIPCSGSGCNPLGAQSSDRSSWTETALDVESAHGVAPGSHLKYWLAATTNTNPELAALENAVDTAANDPTVRVVSNSWGFNADIDDPIMNASLQHAAAVGKTFYFSTGDQATISYPATSPYAVAVGGTTLNLDSHFNYVSESVWVGSGNGCSAVFGRPSWQFGLGSAASCPGRAEPDVAADGDPATGAFVYVSVPGGPDEQVGGTSLSAPLWAGMTAEWNQAAVNASRPPIGFAGPLLYVLGDNPTVYHQVFHDVTAGESGGHAARPGWDEATGFGSANLNALVAQYLHETATSLALTASSNPVTLGNTVTYTATVSPTPVGGTVTFTLGGFPIGGCSGRPLSGARATCTSSYGQAGIVDVQAGYSGTTNFAAAASNIFVQQIGPTPSPPAGYWMLGSRGEVYAFGTSSWRGNANTTNVTHFETTPSRRGYWIVNGLGQVYAFGDAPAFGNAAGLRPGETVTSLSSTFDGRGYWLFTSLGRVFSFGDAHSYGDLSGIALNGPVIGSAATPSGHGYYMVGSDGGIFSFGDAHFYGSMGGVHLNRPVNGLVVTPTNRGYWLVASDGGIFSFGDAGFHGSMGGRALNRPVVGMVRYGNAYLMVASDGGIFDFSDKPFLGSLSGIPIPDPIVSVAS
jgi:kumamolisin